MEASSFGKFTARKKIAEEGEKKRKKEKKNQTCTGRERQK